MLVTVSGITMVVFSPTDSPNLPRMLVQFSVNSRRSTGQPSKACCPTVTLPSTTTSFKFSLLAKAEFSTVPFPVRVTEVSPLPENARIPMLSTFVRLSFLSPAFPAKARTSREPPVMETDSRLVVSSTMANASAPTVEFSKETV